MSSDDDWNGVSFAKFLRNLSKVFILDLRFSVAPLPNPLSAVDSSVVPGRRLLQASSKDCTLDGKRGITATSTRCLRRWIVLEHVSIAIETLSITHCGHKDTKSWINHATLSASRLSAGIVHNKNIVPTIKALSVRFFCHDISKMSAQAAKDAAYEGRPYYSYLISNNYTGPHIPVDELAQGVLTMNSWRCELPLDEFAYKNTPWNEHSLYRPHSRDGNEEYGFYTWEPERVNRDMAPFLLNVPDIGLNRIQSSLHGLATLPIGRRIPGTNTGIADVGWARDTGATPGMFFHGPVHWPPY